MSIPRKLTGFARRSARHRFRMRRCAPEGKLRLSVFRSHCHIYAQIIDDSAHRTLVSATSLEKTLEIENGGTIEAAKRVGEVLAERAKKAKIDSIYLDSSGYKYHGRVAALAQAARDKGLQF